MNFTLSTTTRRRLLTSSFVSSLAIALLPAAMVVQDVDAGKKKKGKVRGTVAERTQLQRDACETIGGGKLAVLEGSNGMNTTECKGGDYDGRTCYNTKKDTTCFNALTQQPSSPLQDNGGLPGDGVNEQPGGGKPAGGGAHVDPGSAEDPGGQATGPIVLFSERQISGNAADVSANDRRRSTRHSRRRGKSRQR